MLLCPITCRTEYHRHRLVSKIWCWWFLQMLSIPLLNLTFYLSAFDSPSLGIINHSSPLHTFSAHLFLLILAYKVAHSPAKKNTLILRAKTFLLSSRPLLSPSFLLWISINPAIYSGSYHVNWQYFLTIIYYAKEGKDGRKKNIKTRLVRSKTVRYNCSLTQWLFFNFAFYSQLVQEIQNCNLYLADKFLLRFFFLFSWILFLFRFLTVFIGFFWFSCCNKKIFFWLSYIS